MKFVISTTKIEKAVNNICKVINSKNALPILGDILCMVDESKKTITMTGSDGETWLTYQLDINECDGSGSFCISADLLCKSLAELPEQPLTVLANTESDMKFRLQHQSGETVLPLDDSNEYPSPRHLDNTVTEWTLDIRMIKRVLKRTMFATANDELRPVMCGIYFDQKDGVLNIVASNGHVLIRNAESVANELGAFIMTKKAAKMLPSLLEGSEDEEVTVSFDDCAVQFERGEMSFTFLMVEGRFPDYMRVIPQDAPYSLEADRKALLKAVRNVAHFTNNSSRLVKFEISSNQYMTLYGEDFDFSTEANDRIDINYSYAKDMAIGMKADSIINELSRLDEVNVTMRFTDPSRAITFTPSESLYEGEEVTMLIMPMILNE